MKMLDDEELETVTGGFEEISCYKFSAGDCFLNDCTLLMVKADHPLVTANDEITVDFYVYMSNGQFSQYLKTEDILVGEMLKEYRHAGFHLV